MKSINQEFWEKKFENRDMYRVRSCHCAAEALKWLKKIKANRILDLGGAQGTDSIFFAKNGFEVFCLDFSERAIDYCGKNVIENKVQDMVHCVLHDITAPLKFDNDSFDGVFAHLSLHYFDDKATTKIFDEIYRVLRTDGLLFVKVKSIEDPTYEEGKKIGKDTYEFEHIRHFFSKNYLLEKTKRFKILSLKQTRLKTDYAEKLVSDESVFWEFIGEKN